jgi:hypothetical protein
MRRLSILLIVAATLLTESGCSWYDAFCQRIANSSAVSPEHLAEKKREDVSNMSEPD